ncbi:hypothetical protein CKO_04124 [Citrobacter koseri ATCC BAA-895]|uniref:Uncharacterized protein n=1 Tax=Citrobacter koseri (strain ATCC BAA-895 / CDC 4225-83 / SGSC4696) TaxID=290338 RepID=A8ANX7_CITK8|nr:hypothetical protein CKO_04124 [Citrobacter koseri ATCC BAA-895]
MALRLSGLRVGYKMPDGTMLIRPTCRPDKTIYRRHPALPGLIKVFR